MALPFLLGAARIGGTILRGGAGVAKSGLRAAGSMGKGALGFGAGAAMASRGGQTAVPSSNEQSMDNVILSTLVVEKWWRKFGRSINPYYFRVTRR